MDDMTDVETLTDEELAQRARALAEEQARRAIIVQRERRTDDLALEALQAEGRVNGAAWEAPMGFVGVFPRGWRVTHGGAVFESVVPGATTAPPSSDWTEVAPDDPLIDFWEDREYTAGEQARDDGRIWTALSTVHGARPSDFPGGWTLTT